MSSDLDGSNIVSSVFVGAPGPPYSFDIDPIGGWIYWAAAGVWRVPIAGGEKQMIADDPLGDEFGIGAHSIALDPIHGHIYWTEQECCPFPDFGFGRLRRANLDGSDAHTILNGLNDAIDPEGVKLPSFNPDYLVVDPVAGLMFVSDAAGGIIYRANLDGSNAVDFVDSPGFQVRGMAIIPVVPEPSTAALAVVGVAAMLAWRTRLRRTSRHA